MEKNFEMESANSIHDEACVSDNASMYDNLANALNIFRKSI